jgi:hypothetical protein
MINLTRWALNAVILIIAACALVVALRATWDYVAR